MLASAMQTPPNPLFLMVSKGRQRPSTVRHFVAGTRETLPVGLLLDLDPRAKPQLCSELPKFAPKRLLPKKRGLSMQVGSYR